LASAVSVDAAVDRVDEAVQPLAGVRVAALRFDDDLVVGGQGRQRDPIRLVVAGDVKRGPVEGRGADPGGHQVDPAGRARAATREAGGGRAAECALTRFAGTVGEIEFDGVGVDVKQLGALDGLLLGEVRYGHRSRL
jgi:hypothetical protein